ncbi:MAG TPA: hypothetical protein VNJ04_10075 [Gemmatimonadaceae bacterium]|nr:hypothetical protein [Gemmatimonadaceae bacterium]
MNRPSNSRLTLQLAAIVAAAVVAPAAVAQAQGRPVPVTAEPIQRQGKREMVIPRGFVPPAGMCRIWIDDVPAGQQPAPTDCASALRNRPANGKVIFGEDPPKRGKDKSKVKAELEQSLGDLLNRRFSR